MTPTIDGMALVRADRSLRLTLRFWLVAVGVEVRFGLALLVVGDAALQRGLDATGLEFNTDGASGVAGPVCRRSTRREAIGLASGSGVALRMWWAPRIGAVRQRCLILRRIDDVGTSVAEL